MARPLSLIASGLALVVLDFRTEALDFVPDPLGWLLVALGATALDLPLAPWLAATAALLSTADAFLPYHRVLLDVDTGEEVSVCPPLGICGEQLRYDPVGGWRLAGLAAALLVGTAATVAVLRGLRRRALVECDSRAATRLAGLAWLVVALWALPPTVAIAGALLSDPVRYDPIWNGRAEYAGLAGWLAVAWVIAELGRHSGRGWAIPRERQRTSPWGHGPDD